MDPLAHVDPDKDTTFALILEGQTRGAESFVCGLTDLMARDDRGFARADQVRVRRPTEDDPRHCEVVDHVELAFDDFDVIWMRKDPPVDDLFLFGCMLLERTKRALVLNDPKGLRLCHEKLWALGFPELIPHTVVSSRPDVLVDFVRRRGKAVVKPLHLMGGMGVMVFEAHDKNLKSAADLLTLDGRRPALAQEFLPAVKDGDKRVILVDGEPVGAVLRVSQPDDVRSNLHVGGKARPTVIDDADRRIARVLGPALRELGLFLVGLDVIGGKLTEVNVTSPTGVQEIDRADGRTGEDRIPAIIMRALEEKLQRRASGSGSY
jgi:glutathione synthase